MKISTLWLEEWVKVSLTAQELADKLTMAGLEVDAISPVAAAFDKVIVAKVLSTKRHPDADKLTLCEVDANLDKPLQIVCGASNVRPGLKVALAMIGAKLPGGLHIKESKLRGELSQGMLCSVAELGLEEHSEGIMELEEDAPVGMDFREYMRLDDFVLDIDLTPNRADCFSIKGVAREVSALNNTTLEDKVIQPVLPVIDDALSIQIKEPKACPRYCGRVIRGIDTTAKTPLWMKERLRRSGVRTIHPVVDIMNYVMFELGQPMHAFDLNTLSGGITVRHAHDSEFLELLDGQEIQLNEQVLVIADKEKPLAMAGIMGGAESAVEEETTDLFLESAYFNPLTISGVARKFGLVSDSSQRYERGVDPELALKALERATDLIQSVVGGKAGPVIEVVDHSYLPPKICFDFNTDKVQKITGVSIALQDMRRLLEAVGVQINAVHEHIFSVQIPSHRFDIELNEDLVEEIIRLYGYDKLKSQAMTSTVQAGSSSDFESIAFTLGQWFRAKGYHETISYSFVDPELQAALYPNCEFMELINPISSELSQMRAGLWPGLLASMLYNVHRQQNTIRFFEMGVVFDVQDKKVQERPCLAGLISGQSGLLNWSETPKNFDFYDLKGDLESLFSMLKLEGVCFHSQVHDALHPGQSAQITIHNEHAGWIGALHPKLNEALDMEQDILLFELDIHKLVNTKPPKYKKISKYPQIRRDLSFLIDKSIEVEKIAQAVKENIKEDWLRSFDVFDVYTGKGIPEDKKSIAVAITLQDDNRTLVDEEINSLISAIIYSLGNTFSIILRE